MKRIYWDLEVSPNIAFSWRIGSKLFLGHHNIIKERAVICVCWKEEGSPKVHSLEWDEGDDRELVTRLAEVIASADELVAHNGDNFDYKWFNTRLLYHGFDPIPEVKTIDTLKLARRKFNFNNNKLDYIASFLGFGHKIDTDFDLWRDIVLDNCPRAMAKMVKYCKKDVVLLEKVYHKLALYNKPAQQLASLEGGERWHCPRCTSSDTKLSKRSVTASGYPRFQMRCSDCHGYYTIPEAAYKGFLAESNV